MTEDDAIYSKKCKLFYKKDGNYVEKGVGMLYLKTSENGKTQLLVSMGYRHGPKSLFLFKKIVNFAKYKV